MSDSSLVLLVLAAVIVLFSLNRLPVEAVALGSALALVGIGVLTPAQVFSGFGDPVVGFVAALFVVSAGLEVTGVTARAGQLLAARTRKSRWRLVALTLVSVAALSALITMNGAVAALLPVVVMLAVRVGMPPSKLVMPLAFAAHAGSMLVLTGTPINVLVSDAAKEVTGRGFGFFSFLWVGVPLVAGTVVAAIFLGDRLLPSRSPAALPPDLSNHTLTLVAHYGLADNLGGLVVSPRSSCVGQTFPSLDTGEGELVVLGALRADSDDHELRSTDALAPGDQVVVRGTPEELNAFAEIHGLIPQRARLGEQRAGALVNREVGLAEVLISPRSALVGAQVFPGLLTEAQDIVVLAVHRDGQNADPGNVTLRAGDTLLLHGSWPALSGTARVYSDDLLLVDSPAAVRRQNTPVGPAGRRALAVMAAMVVLLASGLVSPAIAALLGAVAMILFRIVSVHEAYAGVSWPTVVMVGAMFPLSTAIMKSGAADSVARLIVDFAGSSRYALLAGLFLITVVLGQFVSNTATALIVIPIAIVAAQEVGVSVLPVLMVVAVAAAAAMLTPVATAANLMVYEPGGYRFGDYWRFGLPVVLWFLVVALTVVPRVWPL
ncbi:SLC13 family permease [Streptomyces sp. NBC_00102]|uniref:SLC13 family permease n=1 Tax=Streptomyces sp. NBC_00102 TaxID=2975652 RepID=UPI002259161B|nr:SLC13 family permease [Streptomyces sp. NBC_00102]MCX5401630.1 SLC13 family permease [Streptomyces sp. NBC_00102]